MLQLTVHKMGRRTFAAGNLIRYNSAMGYYADHSLETKEKLAAALKEELQTTEISKVSVSKLISKCGLNRNSFYYHFDNLTDLLRWTFESDISKRAAGRTSLTMREVLELSFQYIDENRNFCRHIYRSMGKEELNQLFFKTTRQAVRKRINEECELHHYQVSDSFKEYLTEHLRDISVFTLYLNNQLLLPKETLINYILCTEEACIKEGLRSASESGY